MIHPDHPMSSVEQSKSVVEEIAFSANGLERFIEEVSFELKIENGLNFDK